MKKNRNNESAITMVALVITIIILLVLATISIRILTDGGLFEKVQEAKKKNEKEELNNTKMLNEYENIINDYIQAIDVKNGIKEIKLNKSEIRLKKGKSEKIIVNIIPEDVDDKEIIWTSSNENVATVIDGIVTAISDGTAIINATIHDESEKSATCTVIVEENILTLYQNGNECENITGGWEKANVNLWNYSNWTNSYTADVAYGSKTSRELIKDSNSMMIKLNYQSGGIDYLVSGTYSTKNMIDVTQYSKLYIEYECLLNATNTGDYAFMFLDFCENKFYIQNKTKYSKEKSLKEKEGDNENIAEFDISDISGEYFLQNRIFIYGSGTNTVDYKIKKILLK